MDSTLIIHAWYDRFELSDGRTVICALAHTTTWHVAGLLEGRLLSNNAISADARLGFAVLHLKLRRLKYLLHWH